MSETDQEAEWSLALAQAAGFARTGATSEAVARALTVHEAAADTLRDDSINPFERAVSQKYVDRSSLELSRFRAQHAAANLSATARSEAFRSREQLDLARRPNKPDAGHP